MADVVTFFRKIITPKLITKKYFFEKTPFLKNPKKFIVIAPSITQILGI